MGHLRKGGTLGRLCDYEERPGQIEMSGALAAAFNAREHLMIEAGTGVGKSLAYLVPAITWAWTNDTPVIISTATRNLQSQLIGSDIPKALRILGDHAKDFRVALLKGRGNYLCLRELGEFFAAGFWTMSEEEQSLMPGLIDFLQRTRDGDLDDYEGLPRSLLACPGEECGGRRCPFYAKCFVYKARQAAASAHLVVVNHSLALAEATGGGGILPPYGRIVFDEAHNLESIATEYLGRELSMPALVRILNRLSRRRGKGRFARSGGVLAAIERQFRKGAFASNPLGKKVMEFVTGLSRQSVRLIGAAEDLLAVASGLLAPTKEGLCRYRVAGGRREYSLHGLFRPYEETGWSEAQLVRAQGELESQAAGLVNRLHELRDALNEAVPEGELNYLSDFASQLELVAASLVDFVNSANFVLLGEKDDHAYWIERVAPERRAAYIRLVASPLSVADELKRLFYDAKDTVALCSATLRVGNDFRYMAKRLGCAERFRMLTAVSPFDYFRQALVLAPDYLPDPAGEAGGYVAALADLLSGLFPLTQARALVLFTSYEMMKAVADRVQQPLAERGMRLLVQGEGLSREAMTRCLREDGRTVLFGAQSFWEGVDVAGEALSCVVIAKLPFAQIGDPVVEARSEGIDRRGGSSFRDYLLPEAVIRFRQGFGRLIRMKSDRGVVVIADPRLMTKSYGAVFRKSIPASVRTVADAGELFRRVEEFLAP